MNQWPAIHHRLAAGAATSLLCLAISAPCLIASAQTAASAPTAAASRPTTDTDRDQNRKPAEMVAFAQVKPGQVVVDYLPGKGYFTRVFSNAVGAQGSVYAAVPQLVLDKFKDKPRPPSVSTEAGYGNVHDVVASATDLHVPVKADLVWTSQNYHDVHIWAGADGTAQLNKSVFDALKPGGLYVILDHAGAAGQSDDTMASLHRIDRAVVVKEVTAAGFVLDGESFTLHNKDDAHTVNVFDPSIRGKTDQFILRFRKPAV